MIDLRQKFNLPSREHCSESRIVVVEVHGQVLGFIVDKVNEVLQVDQSIVAPTPSQVTNADRDCLTGVAKLDSRLLILLDLDRLFLKREVEAAQQAADQ